MLLYGPGVLTDLISTGPITAATTPLLVLRDGQGGPVLVSLSATAQHFFGGMNLEFQNSLWLEYTPGAGPLFGKYTIGAYIAHDSPDEVAVELERLRAVMLEGNRKLAAFIDGLMHGDPAT